MITETAVSPAPHKPLMNEFTRGTKIDCSSESLMILSLCLHDDSQCLVISAQLSTVLISSRSLIQFSHGPLGCVQFHGHRLTLGKQVLLITEDRTSDCEGISSTPSPLSECISKHRSHHRKLVSSFMYTKENNDLFMLVFKVYTSIFKLTHLILSTTH